MPDRIRVLIADDHQLVRKGIRALLSTKTDIEVVGEAADGEAAVEEARRLKPDVVLLDIMMPKKNGIEATRDITAADPGVHVLVLTSFAEDEQVLPALKAGAMGYLLKDTGPLELLESIRRVYRGESSLDPKVARKVLSELSGRPRKQLSADPLTVREVDILRKVAQGRSNKEIASELFISEETVHTHVSSILGKLRLASRTQAALYALKEGIASLGDIPDPRSE